LMTFNSTMTYAKYSLINW